MSAGKKRLVSAEAILQDPNGDLARLRKLGITDYAIITYVVRVLDGQPRSGALHALLRGRPSLSEEQQEFVRGVLKSFPKLPD